MAWSRLGLGWVGPSQPSPGLVNKTIHRQFPLRRKTSKALSDLQCNQETAVLPSRPSAANTTTTTNLAHQPLSLSLSLSSPSVCLSTPTDCRAKFPTFKNTAQQYNNNNNNNTSQLDMGTNKQASKRTLQQQLSGKSSAEPPSQPASRSNKSQGAVALALFLFFFFG